jgi:hypothetical protein
MLPRRETQDAAVPHRSSLSDARLRTSAGHDRRTRSLPRVYGSPESKARYLEIVRRHLADKVRDELAHDVTFTTDITINEAAVRYLAHAEQYYVKNARVTNQHRMIRLALRVARHRYGDLEATEFGPKAPKECQQALVEEGLSRTKANRRVRGFSGLLVAEELIPAATWEALKAVQPPLGGRADPEAFLFDPRKSMADHRAGRRAARKTPLWPSQDAALLRKRTATPVRAARDHYDVASYRRAIHRGCDLAFLHPELSGITEKDLNDQQRAELEAWRKAHRWSPNRLRHAAATRVRRELSIEVATALLGHADADTTTIYAERDLELAREAMARLG